MTTSRIRRILGRIGAAWVEAMVMSDPIACAWWLEAKAAGGAGEPVTVGGSADVVGKRLDASAVAVVPWMAAGQLLAGRR